jgi:selenocysteine-specific elongation factor
MRCLTLGTAGHIDHGKTTLVRALTGTDTDRLPEEKQRGITIDLGFARLPLGDDLVLDVIDVPGHEAFIRNMLAGATGIDVALLVIAADEGVMPQTREHLAILELLGIQRAVVALTKADAADSEWLDLVREDVAGLLADSALAGSPVMAVSARTGDGLEELRAALRAAAEQVTARPADDLTRLPVDRVFTIRGTGTVVTGTLWSGAIRTGDSVRIEPAGLVARVRGLQRHGSEVTTILAGERGAVALAGVDRASITRGDTLIPLSPRWPLSSILTVRIATVRDAASPLLTRQRVRVHLGTAEVLGRLALVDGSLHPAEDGLAQIRLEAPILARAGDRVVIRSYSPVATIAGGVVLEPVARKRKRWTHALREDLREIQRSDTALAALLRIAGPTGVSLSQVPLLLPGTRPVSPEVSAAVGDRLVLRALLDDAAGRLYAALTEFHGERPIEPGLDADTLRRAAAVDEPYLFDGALQQLLSAGKVVLSGGLLAVPGHRPAPAAGQEAPLQQIRDAFARAGLQPTDPAELPDPLTRRPDLAALVRYLEREGALVRVAAGLWMDATALAAAVLALRTQLPVGKQLGIAEFREVLDLSRKHLLPLLEYLDAAGVTRREGEGRLLLPADGPPGKSEPGLNNRLPESVPPQNANGPDGAPVKS